MLLGFAEALLWLYTVLVEWLELPGKLWLCAVLLELPKALHLCAKQLGWLELCMHCWCKWGRGLSLCCSSGVSCNPRTVAMPRSLWATAWKSHRVLELLPAHEAEGRIAKRAEMDREKMGRGCWRGGSPLLISTWGSEELNLEWLGLGWAVGYQLMEFSKQQVKVSASIATAKQCSRMMMLYHHVA